ncbi:hypothetical protein AAC387_Pa06g0111 [Persea americana]
MGLCQTSLADGLAWCQTYSIAEHRQPQRGGSLPYQAVKAATAFAISGTLLFLSGLTLTGTVIGLVLATPLLVIFSPVLVPAAIVTFLLVAGIVSSGGFGAAAVSMMSWVYHYGTGKHPPGADKLDRAQMALASKVRDMMEKAEQCAQQAQARAEAAHSS